MRKVASHLLLFVFTFVFGAFLFAKPAEASIGDFLSGLFNAQESVTTTLDSYEDNKPESLQRHVGSTFSEIQTNGVLSILGTSAISSTTVSKMDPTTVAELEATLGHGVVGDINQGIVAMYNPPASSQTYVADLLESAKIIPEAQAQGLGFSALDPVLETWKTFRNIAYLFFVVIFLVIGFMIMFRSKVGQAAITVQQAIPSILIALLAVTFSYAIAGFLIDLMYLLMYMLAGLFSQGTDIIEMNFFQLVGNIFAQGAFSDTKTAITNMMKGILENGFLDGVDDALSWISGLTGSLIVGIAILIGTFKVFFELLKSYIALILQVVFAPIILMLDAIPGRNKFMDWLKSIAGNLVMWPIVLICLLVNRMLTAPVTGNFITGDVQGSVSGFMPPFLLGQGQGAIFPVLVGIGILLVIPEIMQQAKKAMGVDEGIFGSMAKSAWGQIKDSLPVSGRAASLGVGLGAGAARLVGNIPDALRDDPSARSQSLKHDVLKTMLNTTGKGLKLTSAATRSMGSNQPDIFNPVTNTFDDVFGDEKLREENSLFQLSEDIGQRISPRRTISFLPRKWRDKIDKQKK